MTTETTETEPEATETGEETPKGFADMMKMMEQCGCCGMMAKMKGFMAAESETDAEAADEVETGRKAERQDDTAG